MEPSIFFPRIGFSAYADDMKLWIRVNNEDSFSVLDQALLYLHLWCNNNGLHINSEKTFVISFTLSTPIHHDYFIGNINLFRKNSIRDLGVHLLSDGNFQTHINIITKKAYRILGFLNRFLNQSHNTFLMIKLYKSLVRPILEYSSSIWSPSELYKGQNEQIEDIQRKLIKIILKKNNLTIG